VTRSAAPIRRLLDSTQVREFAPRPAHAPAPSPAECREHAQAEYMSLDAWRDAGLELGKETEDLAWRFGDWWNAGERFGDRVAIVNSPEWTGPAYGTIRNYASVCAAFPLSLRSDKLSFAHHRALLVAPEAKRPDLIAWAVKQARGGGAPASVSELMREIERRDAPPSPPPPSAEDQVEVGAEEPVPKPISNKRPITAMAKRVARGCLVLHPLLRSAMVTDEDWAQFGCAFGRAIAKAEDDK